MKIARLLCAVVISVLLFTVCSSELVAQSGAGSIQGTVTDSTGAVIPAASIGVVNQATKVASSTQSNKGGFYQVPELFTGTYDVTVSAPGFESYKTTIELLVAQDAVINPSLSPGEATAQVQVTASGVQLTTTDSGTLSSTLENARINQLPMNGRYLLALAQETTPGLEAGGNNGSLGFGQRLFGLWSAAIEYVADGVPLGDVARGGQQNTLSEMPDPDSVQQLRIETSSSSAKFATPATGILTTKSGTNSVHGALFETARNNGLGIARTRANAPGASVPQLIRNEYGASAGGPIVLPHIYDGRDRSFWFFGYEKYSNAQNSYVLESVPTLAMKNGDFSGGEGVTGVHLAIYDPNTTQSAANHWARTRFSNNGTLDQIPTSRESAVAKVFLDMTPAPTTADNPYVTPNYNALSRNFEQIDNSTFRLDHAFNERSRAFLRSTIISTTLIEGVPSAAADGIAAGTVGTGSGSLSRPNHFYASAAGFTHVFSPSFFSETVVALENEGYTYGFTGNGKVNYESQLGLPNNFGQSGFPTTTGVLWSFVGDQHTYKISEATVDLDENLTKVAGRHQFQFGGRYRFTRVGESNNANNDTIGFNGYGTALENAASGANYTPTANTGNADADLFIGAAGSYQVFLAVPYQHSHIMEFDGYFQDNYRITRTLTVNLGLRYEAHPSQWFKDDLTSGFDFKNDAMVLAASPATLIAKGYTTQAIINNMLNDGVKFEDPQQAGMNSKLLRDFNFTFGPRFGFAWQPYGEQYGAVIRGGYGRYIFSEPATVSANPTLEPPFTTGYTRNYTTAAQSPDGLPNYLLRAPQTSTGPLSAGTPIMGVNTSNVIDSSSTTAITPGITAAILDYDDAPNYATMANVTLEQPLKGNSVFRLSWVYSHGTNLDSKYIYNSHPSTYTWEMQNGIVPPTGNVPGTNTYSTTATGPYDKVTWATNSSVIQRTGWSNDNALTAEYQRLYHHGFAYQVVYVWSKPMRTGGNAGNDNLVYPVQDYVTGGSTVSMMTSPYGTVITPATPPARPAGTPSYAAWHDLRRFENYSVDTTIPKQHIQFNGIVDLPFGRGRRFLGNANRFVNELVGGFQLAGSGSINSQDFNVTATLWGPTNPIKIYKHKAPITDCRSGVCHSAYLWFNGYIAPTVAGSACTKNCVTGLPTNYVPYSSPIDSTPGTTYYGSNEVNITLPGGTPTPIPFVPSIAATSSSNIGDHPYSHTVLNGPFNYMVNLSLFKVFPITGSMRLRANVDVFNAFNVQGFVSPDPTTGIEQLNSSYNPPRQLQLTLRLLF